MGQIGESLVKLLVAKMGQHINLIPAEAKTPSIDGILQIHDVEHDCNRYINVQIKAGDSHVRGGMVKNRAMLHLGIEDIRDWKKSNYPTIVIWVPGDETKNEAYWRNAQFAKSGANGIWLKTSNKFDKAAFSHLIALARDHAGVLSAPLLQSTPLYPKKVREVKDIAWTFYNEWRAGGGRNPLLKEIKITLKGWRHLTRAGLSQSMICHKLCLLPCAKEIIETSRQIRYMRKFPRHGKEITLVRITGTLKERHRVAAIIDVVLEKEFLKETGRAEYTFLSVYERNHP